MPQLVIEQPGVDTMSIPLSQKAYHLGRAEDNDVVLVADEVSRHHAKILPRGDTMVIVDLNSLNGSYVNRQRIVERVLSHMDEIWLGSKCRVVYRDDTTYGRSGIVAPAKSGIEQDLSKIRAEMDRVGNSLTMIGQAAPVSPTLVVPPRPPSPPSPGAAPAAAQPAPPIAPPEAASPPQPTPDELRAMSRAYRRLSVLYRAGKLITAEFDLGKRLADLLDMAIEVMEAERGFVMLRDEKSGGLRVTVAREMGQELKASSPSMGIAGRAAIDGEPVLMADRDSDDEFGGRQSIIRQRIASAMCVPLQVENRVLGSIYLDSRMLGKTFSTEDLELFSALASQSSMAIENVQLYQRMLEAEKKRASLGRFLSPGVVEAVMSSEKELELGGQRCVVSSLFADVRGFTPMAERLTPDQLVALLNEHFTAMTDIVFEYKGTLDKYNGDEVMALFGTPFPAEDDARRAVQAALAMQARNTELNAIRATEGRSPLYIGIGINTGEVIAGCIGSPKRLDFTVIGDHVNTANRLCSLAKPGQIVVGESTYQSVKDIVRARAIGEVKLKGKETLVQAYEIEGAK